LKNFIVSVFILLVVFIWYLLSIDYFGIYKTDILKKEENRTTNLILHQFDNNLSAISIQDFIKESNRLKKEPFSGFILAESFTNKIMKNREVTYLEIVEELAPLKDLNISMGDIFLLVNIDFPADFWNNKAWDMVTKNFSNLTKAIKDIGLRGIVLNTTPKTENSYKMINFQFPSRNSIEKNATKYQNWEIRGAKYYKSIKNGYRNPNYTFLEHIKKVTQLFRKIMVSISTKYPDITILVYSSIDLNQNSRRPNVYQKAIFLGLQRGAGEDTTIYDMAYINPKFLKEIHFQNSYFWRKYGVAEDRYNNELNETWQWKIPKSDRENWIKRVKVGFIVDTKRLKRVSKITSAVKKALKYSDGYVVLFCSDDNWIKPKNRKRIRVLRERIKKIIKN